MSGYKSIVISGLPASGKSTATETLAKEFNLKQFSVGKMLRAEHHNKYPNNEVSFEYWWRNLDIDYNRKIAESPKSIVENSGIVADTRYVSFIEKEICLRIFITADIDTRSVRALIRGDYSSKSLNEVKLILKQREADEFKLGMDLFKKDYRDPSLYHLVLNSGMLSLEEELAAIKSLFRPSKQNN